MIFRFSFEFSLQTTRSLQWIVFHKQLGLYMRPFRHFSARQFQLYLLLNSIFSANNTNSEHIFIDIIEWDRI
jgi:hypothetical protein